MESSKYTKRGRKRPWKKPEIYKKNFDTILLLNLKFFETMNIQIISKICFAELNVPKNTTFISEKLIINNK